MSTENTTCSRCRFLDRYYTKGVKHFDKTDFGWCMHKNKSINVREDCCDRYELKKSAKIPSRRIQVCLNDLLTEITEVRKILEAESDGEV
ncbi:MAG: hypothetical protein K2O04_05435 [Clostridiales bacterium]|nr:hypothetical protein [Clostridiales bacterium]